MGSRAQEKKASRKKPVNSASNASRQKCAISIWNLIAQTVVFLIGSGALIIERSSVFEHGHRSWFFHWPQEIPNAIAQAYMTQIAHYLFACWRLYKEPRQKDFWTMTCHHIVTLLLITGSFAGRYHRVGLCIMVLHDFSDPLLEIAKLALYAKKQRLADVAFACFAGAFIWTRLWFYPLYIIGSLWDCLYGVNTESVPYSQIFVALLLALQVMHIIWTGMILKVAITAARKAGVHGDVRDVDE